MIELLILFRTLQFVSHHAHHVAKGCSFISDHEFFSELYTTADANYDAAAERLVGIAGEEKLDTAKIVLGASKKTVPLISNDVDMLLASILKLEQMTCKVIESIISNGCTEGCKQLLGEMCNQSEIRQYKLKQRMKSCE